MPKRDKPSERILAALSGRDRTGLQERADAIRARYEMVGRSLDPLEAMILAELDGEDDAELDACNS